MMTVKEWFPINTVIYSKRSNNTKLMNQEDFADLFNYKQSRLSRFLILFLRKK